MKILGIAVALLVASSASAANKYSFVNRRYIDENTDWYTILRTQGYVVKAGFFYNVEGRQIDVMSTCKRGEKVYGWISDPVWGSSEAGVVGVNWREVEVPSTYQRAVCSEGHGAQADCRPVYVTVEQTKRTNFPVKVYAVYNYQVGAPKEMWGVAFTKTFETPECR